MTDYNDGKWHGWNGGECPVDPDAIVDVRYSDAAYDGLIFGKGKDYLWGHVHVSPHIVAFRVTKPAPPKPRECWSYGAHIRDTEAEAIAFRKAVADANPGKGYELGPITKWIEVLP